MMGYLWAFLVGGVLCVIGQVLIDLTSLTPARILVLYVVSGVVLSALGLYGPLVELAGAGATVPLTGFGHLLAQGVIDAVDRMGLLGILAGKYAAMGRIHFAHLRNVAVLDNGFEERAHLSCCGSLDMFGIVKALVENGFDGYVRPDHGRMIWGEKAMPGYGLYDRALGAAYLCGLWEAACKESK